VKFNVQLAEAVNIDKHNKQWYSDEKEVEQ